MLPLKGGPSGFPDRTCRDMFNERVEPHSARLAAFLAPPYPYPAVLREHVLHLVIESTAVQPGMPLFAAAMPRGTSERQRLVHEGDGISD
jgi:hypothetical protein